MELLLSVFSFCIVPGMIFIARIIDVSIGTIKFILIARGMKSMAPLLSFAEVFIWIVTLGQIMKNLDNPVNYVAYAGGFAMGTYVGMVIEERLAIGNVVIQVITSKDTSSLVESLKKGGFAYTQVNVDGSDGPSTVTYTIIKRKRLKTAINTIKSHNPRAFYTIEDVRHVSDAHEHRMTAVTKLMKRIRKGK